MKLAYLNTIRLEANSKQLNTVISLTHDSVIPSIFCLLSTGEKHYPTFLSDEIQVVPKCWAVTRMGIFSFMQT